MATQVVERAATQATALETFRARLIARRPELNSALAGSGVSPDRFIRAAVTAAQTTPELISDVTFQSFWNACLKACRDGLLPDGRQGAIVPYKKQAVWIPMYRGLLDRFEQSGEYKWITANQHREDDIAWDIWIDEHGQHFLHRPGPGFGKVIDTYAAAITKSGAFFISVVNEPDMNHIRSVSRAKSDDAPWHQWEDQMKLKTALRRLCKLLPMPQPLDELMQHDIEAETEAAPALAAPAPAPARLSRPRGANSALQQFADGPEPQQQPDILDEHQAPATQPEAATGDDTSGTGEASGVPTPPMLLNTAHERGKDAKRQNFARKALPPEYREADRAAEADAWRSGWDGLPLSTTGSGHAGQ
jgi:recombination protein RecT